MFEDASRAQQLLVAVILLFAAVGGVLIAALSPSTALPMGVTTQTGPSMGHDEPQASVYVDIQPDVGDVVIFKTESKYIQHRIFADTADGYVTKGDAEVVPDQAAGAPHATEENLAGVVVFTAPVDTVLQTLLAGSVITGLLSAVLLSRRDADTLRRYATTSDNQ
ncbi:hypothetical protein G9464_20630 [Halostella sp. JP-L12]|uniref:hypothetical protein n=1 Tax=Halostella TaxID=1843185 RepID=UPI0013CF28E3|nr:MULTISPECIES: hypothetical protein [Halostella]NHN49978.1 hypothetical protein [Halostella sp. JP-L12]